MMFTSGSLKLALLFGFLLWLIAFLVSIVIFPFHETERPLFESIMPVTLAVVTVVLATRYFRRTAGGSLRAGASLGLVWLGVNLGIDLLIFSWGPMQMPLLEYAKDIGLTYLMIPTITTGIGWAAERRSAP